MTRITVRKVISAVKAAFPPDTPAPFRIDARKACRTIAVLIFAAGFGAFCAGSLLVKVSATGKARYEGASGRLARALSPDDRDYYTYLSVTVVVARLLQLAGLGVGAYGVAAFARPRHFSRFLEPKEDRSKVWPQGACHTRGS